MKYSKKQPVNYIDPCELSCEVVLSQDCLSCTEGLGKMILLLHDKVLNFPQFSNYNQDVKWDMKSWSIERFMKKGIYTADPRKNLFSYFTSGIYLNYINRLKRFYNFKEKHDIFLKQVIEQYIAENTEVPRSVQDQYKELED